MAFFGGRFVTGRYIYPPRAKKVAKPSQLADFESQNTWLGQRKYNGDRCPLQMTPNEVRLWNRHGQRQKYSLPSHLRNELLSLHLPDGESWIDAELLHPKVPNTLVLFDLLQLGGSYLHSSAQENRLEMLHEICGNPTDVDSLMGYPITDHIFLAQTWSHDFEARFADHIEDDLIEGLVLRQKGSFLGGWGNKEYEVDWMVRCRKPSKKYRH